MKNIPISEEFFKRVMQNQKDQSVEAFEPVAKRMMGFYDFPPTHERKIVLVGDAGVGKSTIRETFFQYEDPNELLRNSLEPTRGVEHFNYIMADLNLIVLDTAGQELDDLLNIDPELHFSSVDVVVYVVDASKYLKNSKEIFDTLYRIEKIVRFYSPKVKLSLFFHKIDLIEEKDAESYKMRVKSKHKGYELTERTEIPMYFTSIKESYLKQLQLAFLNLFYL